MRDLTAYCYFFCLLLLSFPQWSKAQTDYNVARISEDFLRNSSAVIRKDDETFTIIDEGKGVLERVFAVTILNKNSDDFSRLILNYSQLVNIVFIEGTLFNAKGVKLKDLKRKDIRDISNGNNHLGSDNRIKAAQFSYGFYPYTVEFRYKIVYNGLLHFPVWNPQPLHGVSLENSTFTIIKPIEFDFRFKEYNLKDPVKRLNEGKTCKYRWSIENLSGLEEESFIDFYKTLSPKVLIAPIKFKMDQYEGTMDTWSNFGDFIWTLNKGRDELPLEIKQELTNLTNSLSNTKDKINAVYKFLQKTTRYVSVAYGIGGWQPADAMTVSKNGYGDCKGLVNYMMAMLKYLNIPSYYTLVNAGKPYLEIDSEFPLQTFNHVILTVPLDRDTLWLECTSQITPFGYLGKFTGGRKALMVKQEGSKLINTKCYPVSVNKTISKSKFQFDEVGSLIGNFKQAYVGEEIERNQLLYVFHQNSDDQKKWIYRHLNINNFIVDSFNFQMIKVKDTPCIEQKVCLKIPNYTSLNKNYVVLNLNPLKYTPEIPAKLNQRKNDILVRNGFIKIDSITMELPEGFDITNIPAEQNFRTDFGEFSSSYNYNRSDKNIQYIQRLVINKGLFPAIKYEEMRSFYVKLTKALKAEIMLKKI